MRKTKFLEQQLGDTLNVLGTTRSSMGEIYAAKEKVQTVQMKTKLLENRLEKAYVKYNLSVTHNKQLRDQINNLRRENIMFQSINSNLERDLQKLKKEMAETIQLANTAFESKEKAAAEMNVLKVQADKEMVGFEEEWKHLTAIIEEDKRERVTLKLGPLFRMIICRYKAIASVFDRNKSMALHGADDGLVLAENQTELFKRRFEAVTATVGLLKTSVQEISDKIGCSNPAVNALLGDDGVTDANLMAYLGIMDQRTNELLQMQAVRRVADGGEAITEALMTQSLTALSNRIVIEPPSATHEEEFEEMEQEPPLDDERPLSRECLTKRMQKTLPRKLDGY